MLRGLLRGLSRAWWACHRWHWRRQSDVSSLHISSGKKTQKGHVGMFGLCSPNDESGPTRPEGGGG